jgi:hypothetical protein
MSKYGEFEVVRTERRKCKRANDPHADEEGMRVYTYLKCPHCHSQNIEIATTNLDTQKRSVIRDHMLICPSFTGERPPKRNKTAADMPVAPDEADKTCEIAKLKADIATLKQMSDERTADMAKSKADMATLKQMTDERTADLDKLVDKSRRYDDIFMALLEEPAKIDRSTQTPTEWEKPNSTSPFFSRFVTRIQDENANLRAQVRELQQQLGDSDGILV